jgi:hypothetical protein
MSSPRLLDGPLIRELLAEVAAALPSSSTQHIVIVAGGSLLAWMGLRDATEDVDSIQRLDAELRDAVASVAARPRRIVARRVPHEAVPHAAQRRCRHANHLAAHRLRVPNGAEVASVCFAAFAHAPDDEFLASFISTDIAGAAGDGVTRAREPVARSR